MTERKVITCTLLQQPASPSSLISSRKRLAIAQLNGTDRESNFLVRLADVLSQVEVPDRWQRQAESVVWSIK